MTASKGGHTVALFPASFDPVTNGHLDLVRRARAIFDEVVVAVASNVEKSGTFSEKERLEILLRLLRSGKSVRIHNVHLKDHIGSQSLAG